MLCNSKKKEDRDKALKRIKNFKNAKKIEIGWTSFDPKELMEICSDPGVLGIKFFFATKNGSGKDDAPDIMLQVRKSETTIGAGPVYEYYEGTDSGVCPPPQGSCDDTIEMPQMP